MKALPVRDLPTGHWIYEMKFDGYRALAFKAGKEARLVSRNQVDFGNDYSQLIDSLKMLTAKNVSGKRTPLVYYAFDLLNLEGTDLRSRPLVERRKLLAKLLKKAPDNIRFSEELHGDRDHLLQVARQFQLEGLIAKRPESVYESGRRSGAWVKVKLTPQQEFVIGGYTPPAGSRTYRNGRINDQRSGEGSS